MTNKVSIAKLQQWTEDHDKTHTSMSVKIDTIDNCIDRLMSNDLPHLEQAIGLIQQDIRWMKKIGWFSIATNIAVWAFIVEQIVKYILT